MEEQVEKVLWCPDCMTKHARDLLHHAEAMEDSRLREIAEEAFEISSDMLGVKDRKRYSEIRDLEHHTEDLLTALRTERKKLSHKECETCGPAGKLMSRFLEKAKDLNTNSDQELIVNLKHGGHMKDVVVNALVGNLVGKGVSVATPMMIPGATMGIANKTIANVVIGGVLTGASLMGKLPSKIDMLGAVAGTNLIASELVDLLMGYAGMGMVVAPAAVGAAAVRAVPASGGTYPYATTFGAPGASAEYSNGGLIFVD
jgi:hypothetical protein